MGILENLTKNPSFLALAGVGIVLFIFKDKISDFFSTISGGAAAASQAGEITQTALDTLQGNQQGLIDSLNQLTTDFGQFQTDVGTNFANIPDFFSNLFNQQQDDTPPQANLSDADKQAAANALEINRLRSMLENQLAAIPADENLSGSEFASARNANEFRARQEAALQAALRTGGQGSAITVPIGNELGLGGGTFQGGVTTLGDNLVDTLSEVLRAFPQLSASQASNLLADNQGLTQSEFSFVNPFGSSSLSSAGVDPDQIFNNSSGGFSGLTPEQIAQLLTGGNISNF